MLVAVKGVMCLGYIVPNLFRAFRGLQSASGAWVSRCYCLVRSCETTRIHRIRDWRTRRVKRALVVHYMSDFWSGVTTDVTVIFFM